LKNELHDNHGKLNDVELFENCFSEMLNNENIHLLFSTVNNYRCHPYTRLIKTEIERFK